MSEQESTLSEQERQARRLRVETKARAAIEHLAAVDLAAAASVLRVGRIEVVEDQSIPTAALHREHGFSEARFRIVLNAEFCDRSDRDVTAILLHELLHHVMRHLEANRVGDNPKLSNIVEDAFINRTIHLLNPELAGFFSDFYEPAQMPQLLLRSGSQPQSREDQQLYHALQMGQITEEDLYHALQDRGGGDQDVQLIGSHEDEAEGDRSVISEEAAEGLLQELGEQLRARGNPGKNQASRLDQLSESFLRLRRGKRLAPLQRAMQRALTQSLRSNLLHSVAGGSDLPSLRTPLMPERPARADMYWILAGMQPVLWRTPESNQQQGAVAVYLDVSGSMMHYLGTAYECCLAFEDMLSTEIYLFSNQIETIHIDQLRSGDVRTTYGTDFDCVVEHFLEQGSAEKAVLFSDGYAELDPAYQDKLTASSKEMIGVLTPRGNDRVMRTFCSELFHMPEA